MKPVQRTRVFDVAIAVAFAIVCVGCMFIAGCGDPGSRQVSPGAVAVTDGASFGTLQAVQIPDGPRCVVLIGNSKGALSCDWAAVR